MSSKLIISHTMKFNYEGNPMYIYVLFTAHNTKSRIHLAKGLFYSGTVFKR